MSDQAYRIAAAIAEVIQELGEVPSGHVYARLMGIMSLDVYEQFLQVLIRSKLIRREGDVLYWMEGKDAWDLKVPTNSPTSAGSQSS